MNFLLGVFIDAFFSLGVVIYTYSIVLFRLNHSRPDPRWRENINLNFYFHTTLCYLKRFYEGLKDFHKTFWGTKVWK